MTPSDKLTPLSDGELSPPDSPEPSFIIAEATPVSPENMSPPTTACLEAVPMAAESTTALVPVSAPAPPLLESLQTLAVKGIVKTQAKFREVPSQREQGYFEHLADQGMRGATATGYGLMILTNAIFPFWFDTADCNLENWVQRAKRKAKVAMSAMSNLSGDEMNRIM